MGWDNQASALFRNDGNFTFTDVTVAASAKPATGVAGTLGSDSDGDERPGTPAGSCPP